MSKKVLFSPIGGTDPISNFHDGSMLHICRVYKPEVVVLYISKEMCDYHKQDDRYRYCINKLYELLDRQVQIKLIERPDLVDVYDFDFFYKEFEGLLNEVHEEFEGEMLLNISSGTPGMKSALNVLSQLMNIKMQPIQVTTPEKKINPHEDDRDNYDVATYWELNVDNDPNGFNDRTLAITNRNHASMMVKNNIGRLLDAYDYNAALDLAMSICEFISDEALNLLKVACMRASLDYSSFVKDGGNKFNLMPVQTSDARDIVEYIMILQIKAERGEYADLLRGITPVFMELCKREVQIRCGVDLKSITYINKKTGALCWKSEDEFKAIHPQIFDLFVNEYGKYRGGYVASDALTKIIYKYEKSAECRKLFDEFRAIEENIRNIAAHNLVAITEDWISKKCGNKPDNIIKQLRTLVKVSGINISRDGWNSYKNMNELIKNKLQIGE